MSKLVLIWPSPWDHSPKNGLFEKGFSLRGSFKRAYALWREKAALEGFLLHTYDMFPIENAELLWFINMPKTRGEYLNIRKKNYAAPTVLQINESPLLAPYMFHEENVACFDSLVTYDHSYNRRNNVFYYHLPFTVEYNEENIPYQNRRHACIINSNRVEGWFGMRQKGLSGLPGIGLAFNGWKWKFSDFIVNHRHGLYSVRRELCRAAEDIPNLQFDIYGSGWDGEQISWCPIYPTRKYRLLNERYVPNKIKTAGKYRFNIAYENYRGNKGYIDIKIFDSLIAGSIPVYLGDDNIKKYVPEKCFVDARNFKNCRELLLYLKSCPEAEWEAMREAGQEFIRSEKIRPFTDEAFAERMMEVLRTVLGK